MFKPKKAITISLAQMQDEQLIRYLKVTKGMELKGLASIAMENLFQLPSHKCKGQPQIFLLETNADDTGKIYEPSGQGCGEYGQLEKWYFNHIFRFVNNNLNLLVVIRNHEVCCSIGL